jgi:hypothetical protein
VIKETYLEETDLAGSFTEALSANVQSVLADDGVTVGADTAKGRWNGCGVRL